MNLIDHVITVPSIADSETRLYFVGDTHIGAYGCAEGHLKRFIRYIGKQRRAYWIGGGDYCEFITQKDVRRWDVRVLPDWLLEGDPASIREAMTDVGRQQRKRFLQFVAPIEDRCLGLLQGNHEDTFELRTDTSMQARLCEALHVPDLTDCAFVRLRFKTKGKSSTTTSTVVVFAAHGWGSGRTPGAEANHLRRLANSKEANIVARGHSHTYHCGDPIERLDTPRRGALPDECGDRILYPGNWGCWVRTYPKGPGTYVSKRCYDPRPLMSLEVVIKPFVTERVTIKGRREARKKPQITMRPCPYYMESA